jgi:hypothetical protein
MSASKNMTAKLKTHAIQANLKKQAKLKSLQGVRQYIAGMPSYAGIDVYRGFTSIKLLQTRLSFDFDWKGQITRDIIILVL